jgi:hypothetical protein
MFPNGLGDADPLPRRDVKGKLEGMSGDARATSPAEMRALVASQFATWTRLAKEASISID